MSEIKVNKISPRTACGTTTLGDSGDTFTIPSGVTITNNGTANGFGATGAVNWQTTVKTSTFTAVAGEGYFVNTTGGAVTVNLPSGTAGAVVGIKDYANTFDTHNVTVAPNGSDKIAGDNTVDATLSVEGLAVTFVFVDSTQGWLVTDSGLQSDMPTAEFITATGGTITEDGDYKVHTFTGPGTFTVCSVGNSGGSTEISYMVVAGGAGAGATANPSTSDAGGGGGAGGFREGKTPQCTYTSSPLACTSGSNNGLSVTATGYPVTVGGGGPGGSIGSPGTNGSPSTFAGSTTITSTGGGAGRHNGGPGNRTGVAGGSGGGPSGGGSGMSGGAGNTPPVSPPQGNPGSAHSGSPDVYGGGGGGAGGAAADSPNGNPASDGGVAVTSSINGTATTYAGGGGGGGSPAGPGGQGGDNPSGPARGGGGPGGNAGGGGNPGTANTGGGGGGGGGNAGPSGGSGGSGIVIIRYKFQ